LVVRPDVRSGSFLCQFVLFHFNNFRFPAYFSSRGTIQLAAQLQVYETILRQ
jgi:hypothetical protein